MHVGVRAASRWCSVKSGKRLGEIAGPPDPSREGAGNRPVVNAPFSTPVLESAKLNGLDPEAYLAGVVDRIAKGHPISRLNDFLPGIGRGPGPMPIRMATASVAFSKNLALAF